ncbi:unnamed protein product, partial [Effrenium voratum]
PVKGRSINAQLLESTRLQRQLSQQPGPTGREQPVQWWPHEAFEGMRGDAPCSLPLLVARCQAPDGYLLAPFQEAVLQLYGGSRMPCPGPARAEALAPRDDAAVAAAARLAAPRRRRRPRRQRRAEGEADAWAAPANAVASPAPPSAGEQREPLQAMREVDLAHELRRRVYTLQSPPGPMRGAPKAALTAGLTEVQRDPSSAEGWKLFLLAAAGSDVPGPSRANAADDDAQRRAERAAALAHLGELSAASAALTAMPMAPASLETLAALRDPERRPPTCQVPLPPDFRSSRPRDPLALNLQRFLHNVRSGRRGAAAGPSGCTAEHLRVLADDEASADLLLRATECRPMWWPACA